MKCQGKRGSRMQAGPPHPSIHGSGPAHKNSFSDEEIREAVQQALEVFPVGAQMMLKECVHIHILGQAHHQIFIQLLMLHAEGLHIHLAQSGVQIAHTIHMGGNVVHGLPDAVIAGIGIQALMDSLSSVMK